MQSMKRKGPQGSHHLKGGKQLSGHRARPWQNCKWFWKSKKKL